MLAQFDGHTRPSAPSDGGFSLAELMVAAVIMFIVAMGVLSALAFAAGSVRASSMRDTALNVANSEIEFARNVPYDSVGEVGGDPVGVLATSESTTTPQGTFSITTDVSWIRDTTTGRAKFKRVMVTVSWDVAPAGSVVVSTDIFGKSLLINVGDVQIQTLRKSDNSPLSNTQVTIQPSIGAPRGVNTDASGIAFFGQVPAGSMTIWLSNGAYVFDPSQFSGSSVTADLLNSYTIYGQLPASANVHVTGNPSGANIAGATVRVTNTSTAAVVYGTTDGSGIAHFDNLFIGAYTLSVSCPGRTTVSGQTLNIVTEGSTVNKDISMTDPASLVVRAVDGANAKVSGATVTVVGPAPSTSQVTGSPGTTAVNGEVSFANLLDGSYTVLVQKSGYADNTVTVALSGTNVTQVVTMVPNGPGSILVTLLRGNGTPYANSSSSVIRIYEPDGTTVNSYKTNSSGQVLVNGKAPGAYSVIWKNSSGTWSSKIPVTVSPSATSNVTINSNY